MTSPSLAPIAGGIIDADLLRALAATNRPALERMIAISIDILDEIDGDPDAQDGNGAEDEPCAWFKDPDLFGPARNNAPGCPIADPGGEDEGYGPQFKPDFMPLFMERH